jgi:hypothetical protein
MPEHVHLWVDGPEGAVIKYRFANSWMGQERPSAAEAACIGGPSGTAEQLAEKLQNQRIGALRGRDLSRALRSSSKTYGAAEAVPLQKL